MKPIKMFGLAALLALLATAFVGVSPAAAGNTVLCSNDSNEIRKSPCTKISHVHEESVGHAKLLSSFATVECEVLFLGEVTETGSPLNVSGNFTYTCLNGCTATEENGPAEIQVLREGTELAAITGEGLVHVVCGLNCRYNGVGLAGHGLGALEAANEVGEITIEGATVNKESGFLCPSTSKLDITTEPLTATYLGGAELSYCVEYEHKAGGSYQNSNCTTAGAGAYELVWGSPGLEVGKVVCVVDYKGLWLKEGTTNCAKDYSSLTGGEQEKATIKTVE